MKIVLLNRGYWYNSARYFGNQKYINGKGFGLEMKGINNNVFIKLCYTLTLLLSINMLKAQDYNIKPYEVTLKSEILGPSRCKNNKLFFNFLKIQYGYMSNLNLLTEADTSFYDVRLVNLNDMTTKKTAIKSTIDTIRFCWTHTPIFDSTNNRYYFYSSKIARSSFNLNIKINKWIEELYVDSYDTNMANQTSVKLERISQNRSYHQCNKLIKGDSLIYSVSLDSNFIYPLLCKLNLKTGALLDTVSLIDKFPSYAPYHSGFFQMDWVNDSVIVLLSDYIQYYNVNNMKLLDTFLYTFPIWQDYAPPSSVKFNILDTSYNYYVSKDYKQAFYKITSKGIASKLFEIPINTISPFSTNDINAVPLNFDFIYDRHIYGANTTVLPTTDTFSLSHFSKSGNIDWIKIIQTPSLCAAVNIIAMEDSSVFVFIQCYQPDDNSKYDLYYLKVNQYGQEIFPTTIDSKIKLSNEIFVYPNPSNGKFYLANILVNDIKTINLLNSNGQKIKILSNSIQMDLSDYPNGNYFVEIVTTKNERILKKIRIN